MWKIKVTHSKLSVEYKTKKNKKEKKSVKQKEVRVTSTKEKEMIKCDKDDEKKQGIIDNERGRLLNCNAKEGNKSLNVPICTIPDPEPTLQAKKVLS